MSILLSSLRPPVLRRGPSFCILGRVRYNPPKMREASKPHSEPDTVEALRLAHLIVSGDVDAWCDQDSDKLAAHALLRLEEQLEALQNALQRIVNCAPTTGQRVLRDIARQALSNPASRTRRYKDVATGEIVQIVEVHDA